MNVSSFNNQNQESSGGSSRGLRSRPPPPNLTASAASYSQAIATSMTIDEMRQLHQRSLRDAEAKQTELRLVLASRYRELVGSSDEVILMKQRAQELHELVSNLPNLIEKLSIELERGDGDSCENRQDNASTSSLLSLRQKLSALPRIVHRALDAEQVHEATAHLITLFSVIAERTEEYPLANSLAISSFVPPNEPLEDELVAQIRMTYLQMQSVPRKIRRIAGEILQAPASYYGVHPIDGAIRSAAALSSLYQLGFHRTKPEESLLDTYFECKGHLIKDLLDQLQTSEQENVPTDTAEEILSQIVLILQHDVIIHPYEIFVLKRFPNISPEKIQSIAGLLPVFDSALVKQRCSKFLSAHLPLIRSKVKLVLMDIAGTTASALGQIRQSLYDKTDGAECIDKLNQNDACTWDEAVHGMVDGRIAFSQGEPGTSGRVISLWGCLFSNTFSSLVHSLLTTSFQSVHSSVVATLRASLSNAPPLESLSPHDAYRNMLLIATDLDKALLKVANDAHELLVHAEEREESERRLRQSLYVQTCEIMGRLLCQLRSMVSTKGEDITDARKELIVGRLCYLLKFRLASLPRLLDCRAMDGVTGMVSYIDLKSAFDLADDNDDGLISFTEATLAVESAFSGTTFRGADMLRETLLLTDSSDAQLSESTRLAPLDVSLDELSLLAARGVRHGKQGQTSALGSVQSSLDGIVQRCFELWAQTALSCHDIVLEQDIHVYHSDAMDLHPTEWERLYGNCARCISTSLFSYTLHVANIFGRYTCPSDVLCPVPSEEYSSSLGLGSLDSIASLREILRQALLSHAITKIISIYNGILAVDGDKYRSNNAIGSQLAMDIYFVSEHMIPSNNANGLSSSHRLKNLLLNPQGLNDSNFEAYSNESLATSGLLLSALMTSSSKPEIATFSEVDLDSFERSRVAGTRNMPLQSSRRFPLLPVQSDKSLADLQVRGQRTDRDRKAKEPMPAGNVVSSGLGFLSSMLKKK